MNAEDYSTKLLNLIYNYLIKKFNNIKEEINKINTSFSKNKEDLQDKINSNKKSIDNVATNMSSLTSKIEQLENNPKTSIEGDYIQINDIEQIEIENVKSGETIEIKNENSDNKFIIQCFAQMDEGECVTLKSIECKPENKDLFEFDERYVELTEEGFKPKTYTTMDMEKIEENEKYTVYATTTAITQELLDNINNITAIEVR